MEYTERNPQTPANPSTTISNDTPPNMPADHPSTMPIEASMSQNEGESRPVSEPLNEMDQLHGIDREVSPAGLKVDEDDVGPMWKLAMEQPLPKESAATRFGIKDAPEGERPIISRKKPEDCKSSLFAKTRARAAVEVPYGSPVKASTNTKNSDAYKEELLNSLSSKRTRVVPLLLGGVMGLFGGFFGSIYTQTSCHFATVKIEVGEYNSPFKFHYGMWKYTPIDSVFAGYSYCAYYKENSTDIPQIPRLINLTGLVFGFIGLSILWTYLAVGVARKWSWRVAVAFLSIAAACNFMTLFFFAGEVCRTNVCTMGPSSYTVLLSTFSWALLAYLVHQNTPLSIVFDELKATEAISNKDIHRRAKSFLNLLPLRGVQKDVPSLSTFAKRNLNFVRPSNSGGGDTASQSSENYKPPEIV